MRRTCLCFPSFTTIRIGLICNDPAGNSYPMVELLGLAARVPSAVPGLLEVAGKRRLGQRCPALAPARGERGAVLRPTGRRRRVPTPGRGPRRGHQTEVPNVHDGRKVIVIPLELGY
jgi:hypothetical protein